MQTDNDSPAVALRKNLSGMPQTHDATVIANDYYEMRMDGNTATTTQAIYTGEHNGIGGVFY